MTNATDASKVVLIVDPDGVASGALGRSLKRLGCEPQSCWDMHAALIVARVERPALVIASAELLDGDGFALCDQLRGEAHLSGMPVAILYEESSAARVKAHEASPTRADAYLSKPISVTGILERVGKFLTEGGEEASVDDDELSLNSAVEVVETRPAAKPPLPRPSVKPPSAMPPPPAVPKIPESSSRIAKASVAPSSRPVTSMRPPGTSTKDYLELREQLNARDREIHRLREELASSESKNAEVAERAEGLRSANRELLEKIRERDQALGSATTLMQQLDAARADKELANKRAESYVTKSERTKQELAAERDRVRALEREVEALRQQAGSLESLRAELEGMKRAHFEAEQRLVRERDILARARESLVEAMRSVEVARAPAPTA